MPLRVLQLLSALLTNASGTANVVSELGLVPRNGPDSLIASVHFAR